MMHCKLLVELFFYTAALVDLSEDYSIIIINNKTQNEFMSLYSSIKFKNKLQTFEVETLRKFKNNQTRLKIY